jgi:hypothetical protein
VTGEIERAFDVTPPPPGYRLSLRRRVTKTTSDAGWLEAWSYVLLLTEGEDPPGPANTVGALYWFPDDTVHECYQFDCADCQRYQPRLACGADRQLMPLHERRVVTLGAVIA